MDSSPQLAYLLAKMADEQPEKLPTPASCTAGMKLTTNHIQEEEDVPTYSRMGFADFWIVCWGKRLLPHSIVSDTLLTYLPTLHVLFHFWLNEKE